MEKSNKSLFRQICDDFTEFNKKNGFGVSAMAELEKNFDRNSLALRDFLKKYREILIQFGLSMIVRRNSHIVIINPNVIKSEDDVQVKEISFCLTNGNIFNTHLAKLDPKKISQDLKDFLNLVLSCFYCQLFDKNLSKDEEKIFLELVNFLSRILEQYERLNIAIELVTELRKLELVIKNKYLKEYLFFSQKSLLPDSNPEFFSLHNWHTDMSIGKYEETLDQVFKNLSSLKKANKDFFLVIKQIIIKKGRVAVEDLGKNKSSSLADFQRTLRNFLTKILTT